jgi:hypothetical protein
MRQIAGGQQMTANYWWQDDYPMRFIVGEEMKVQWLAHNLHCESTVNPASIQKDASFRHF